MPFVPVVSMRSLRRDDALDRAVATAHRCRRRTGSLRLRRVSRGLQAAMNGQMTWGSIRDWEHEHPVADATKTPRCDDRRHHTGTAETSTIAPDRLGARGQTGVAGNRVSLSDNNTLDLPRTNTQCPERQFGGAE